MTVAIYPGSFDPITNGHLDIAVRASKLFQKVVISIYDMPAKNLMFSTEERVSLTKQAITSYPNIEVQAFTGLTVDFAKTIGAQAIVRGLRVGSDFEREFEMAMMNKKLSPDVEIVCLMSNVKYQFVSSSLLKEVASLGGFIDDIVPSGVAKAVKEKIRSKTVEVYRKYPE